MQKKMCSAILAGGLSSRMNYKDKATLVFEGKTFLENILEELTNFDETIIVSNNDLKMNLNSKIKIHRDIVKEIGPLGGIFTVLNHSSFQRVFVTSCDMPQIKGKFIDEICAYEDFDIVIPQYNEKYEMLFAVYSKNCLAQIKKLIERKSYKITGLLEDHSLKVKIIPINKEFYSTLRNINTKKDYFNLLD